MSMFRKPPTGKHDKVTTSSPLVTTTTCTTVTKCDLPGGIRFRATTKNDKLSLIEVGFLAFDTKDEALATLRRAIEVIESL